MFDDDLGPDPKGGNVIRPGEPVINNTGEGSLLCPSCSGYSTHIDLVQVERVVRTGTSTRSSVKRRERPGADRRLDSGSAGSFGEGRRHRIARLASVRSVNMSSHWSSPSTRADTIIEQADTANREEQDRIRHACGRPMSIAALVVGVSCTRHTPSSAVRAYAAAPTPPTVATRLDAWHEARHY